MRYVIPTPPSVNALYRNVPKVGRVKATDYKSWITLAMNSLVAQRAKPIPGPVNVTMLVESNGRRDLDGHVKALLDLLVKCEIIESDRFKTVKNIHMGWHEMPGCAVTITPLSEARA